jgi:hypothetical protein
MREPHETQTTNAPTRFQMSMSAFVEASDKPQTISAKPQACAYRPDRIIIAAPEDWIVNDIIVNGQSQLMQSTERGGIPGAAFSAGVDCPISCETIQAKMTFDLVVTYVGPRLGGAFFTCGVFGLAAA